MDLSYDITQYSKILEYFAIFIVIFILYFKIPKSKKTKIESSNYKNNKNNKKGEKGIVVVDREKDKEKDRERDNKEKEDIINAIAEIQLKSSNNSYAIHNLQLENYELRNKLDKIYSNDLNENINYYKNIILMNEKIEYMQKLVLKTSDLNDKFDMFTQYVNSKIRNV